MTEKILFVDDELAALDGYKRMLHHEFAVETASGPSQALIALQETGPYVVVISDMCMPSMSGSEFLSQVRQSHPDTVRILLTGHADLADAIDAVNRGNIFRFLTKPCEKQVLVNAITASIEQYRLVTSEHELLENTLLASIKVLADVLSAATPEAFGRSMRIAVYVRHLLTKFNLSAPWRFEAAATLSQLGCVTLDADLLQRAYVGIKLSAEDQARFNTHPSSALQLLAHIPRLESVAWMIGQQLMHDIPVSVPEISVPTEIIFGAKMLKLAVAYEQLRSTIPAKEDILARLRDRLQDRRSEFDGTLLDALSDLPPDTDHTMQLQKVPTIRLRTGMVLAEEIKNGQGVLLVAKGQELTSPLLMKLDSFSRAGLIAKEFMAFVAV
jgi:FixJ family two-component response regulator